MWQDVIYRYLTSTEWATFYGGKKPGVKIFVMFKMVTNPVMAAQTSRKGRDFVGYLSTAAGCRYNLLKTLCVP